MQMNLGTWQISIKRIPPTGSELAAMYDRAAQRWQSALYRSGYEQVYVNLFRRLQAEGVLRHLYTGGRVLDCGIGTAAFSLALVTSLPVPIQIDGVDLSARMLEEARRTLQCVGVSPRLYQRDMYHVPFGHDSFDLVMGAHLLEHLDDPRRGLAEMIRVLRPGAPLVIVITRPGFVDSLIQLKWRYNSITALQLTTWMHALGLTNIRQYDLATEQRFLRFTSIACVGVKPC